MEEDSGGPPQAEPAPESAAPETSEEAPPPAEPTGSQDAPSAIGAEEETAGVHETGPLGAEVEMAGVRELPSATEMLRAEAVQMEPEAAVLEDVVTGELPEMSAEEELLLMFPDLDELYLRRKLAEGLDPAQVADHLTTDPDYPRRSQRLELEEAEARREELEDPARFNMAEFLRVYPDPEAQFASVDGAVSGAYRRHALVALLNEFPNVREDHLGRLLDRHNGHFTPAVREMRASEGGLDPRAEGTANRPRKRKRQTAGPVFLAEDREARPWPAVVDEAFFRELQFLRHEREIRAAVEERRRTREAAVARARDAGQLHECPVCTEEVLEEELLPCRRQRHRFCRTCVRRQAETVVGDGGHRVDCLSGDCPPLEGEEPGMGEVEGWEQLLPDHLHRFLDRRRQEVEIRQAEVEGLETCPFCDFAMVLEGEAGREFRCLGCGRASCRECRKLSHLPKSCSEADEAGLTGLRTAVEEAMARALVRRCPSCQTPAVKSTGCNHIRCTRCSAHYCYDCGKDISGNTYAHFTTAPGGCKQYTVDAEAHDARAKKAGEEAKEEYLRKHPEVHEELAKDEASKAKEPDVDKLVGGSSAGERERAGLYQQGGWRVAWRGPAAVGVDQLQRYQAARLRMAEELRQRHEGLDRRLEGLDRHYGQGTIRLVEQQPLYLRAAMAERSRAARQERLRYLQDRHRVLQMRREQLRMTEEGMKRELSTAPSPSDSPSTQVIKRRHLQTALEALREQCQAQDAQLNAGHQQIVQLEREQRAGSLSEEARQERERPGSARTTDEPSTKKRKVSWASSLTAETPKEPEPEPQQSSGEAEALATDTDAGPSRKTDKDTEDHAQRIRMAQIRLAISEAMSEDRPDAAQLRFLRQQLVNAQNPRLVRPRQVRFDLEHLATGSGRQAPQPTPSSRPSIKERIAELDRKFTSVDEALRRAKGTSKGTSDEKRPSEPTESTVEMLEEPELGSDKPSEPSGKDKERRARLAAQKKEVERLSAAVGAEQRKDKPDMGRLRTLMRKRDSAAQLLHSLEAKLLRSGVREADIREAEGRGELAKDLQEAQEATEKAHRERQRLLREATGDSRGGPSQVARDDQAQTAAIMELHRERQRLLGDLAGGGGSQEEHGGRGAERRRLMSCENRLREALSRPQGGSPTPLHQASRDLLHFFRLGDEERARAAVGAMERRIQGLDDELLTRHFREAREAGDLDGMVAVLIRALRSERPAETAPTEAAPLRGLNMRGELGRIQRALTSARVVPRMRRSGHLEALIDATEELERRARGSSGSEGPEGVTLRLLQRLTQPGLINELQDALESGSEEAMLDTVLRLLEAEKDDDLRHAWRRRIPPPAPQAAALDRRWMAPWVPRPEAAPESEWSLLGQRSRIQRALKTARARPGPPADLGAAIEAARELDASLGQVFTEAQAREALEGVGRRLSQRLPGSASLRAAVEGRLGPRRLLCALLALLEGAPESRIAAQLRRRQHAEQGRRNPYPGQTMGVPPIPGRGEDHPGMPGMLGWEQSLARSLGLGKRKRDTQPEDLQEKLAVRTHPWIAKRRHTPTAMFPPPVGHRPEAASSDQSGSKAKAPPASMAELRAEQRQLMQEELRAQRALREAEEELAAVQTAFQRLLAGRQRAVEAARGQQIRLEARRDELDERRRSLLSRAPVQESTVELVEEEEAPPELSEDLNKLIRQTLKEGGEAELRRLLQRQLPLREEDPEAAGPSGVAQGGSSQGQASEAGGTMALRDEMEPFQVKEEPVSEEDSDGSDEQRRFIQVNISVPAGRQRRRAPEGRGSQAPPTPDKDAAPPPPEKA